MKGVHNLPERYELFIKKLAPRLKHTKLKASFQKKKKKEQ
jgi:hypothetical protein